MKVPKRGVPKWVPASRVPIATAQGSNQRWRLEFVSGSLFCESRLHVLSVIDDFSRECLAAGEDTSLLGLRVSRELNRLAQIRGHPRMAVSDNGTELTGNAGPEMAGGPRGRMALHRAGQAHAERVC
jgi:putative transposase